MNQRPGYQYQQRGGMQQQQQQKKTSGLVSLYYKSRWANFFLSFVGILFIFIGIYYVEAGNWFATDEPVTSLKWMPWMAAGALIAGLSIYSNKRR